MPEPASQGRSYLVSVQSDAARTLTTLPREAQLHWIQVQLLLVTDPVDHHHVRAIGSSGRLYLFDNPSPPLQVTYELDNDNAIVDVVHFSAPQLQDRSNRLVVIYSEQDRNWFDDLVKWIGGLEDSKLIELWDVSEIDPGADPAKAIEQALETARATLLLVTQDFLAGDLKDDQLRLTELLSPDRNVEVQWIAVRASIWNSTSISNFQPINDPKRPLAKLQGEARNDAWLDIYEKIKKIAEGW